MQIQMLGGQTDRHSLALALALVVLLFFLPLRYFFSLHITGLINPVNHVLFSTAFNVD